MSLTLNAAQAMIERARAHATDIGVPMNIAVTDGGGHLLAFARMDGAILGSIEIALAKAKTSILFNAPSRANFAETLEGQSDPQEMIDEMVAVIGADDGKYRNMWPPSWEELVKQVQQDAWTRPVQPQPEPAGAR
jgi:uncharacterized protein GlcG (DUF336 family)